ncbi:type II toxin-antitoxin system RelE/ParE family toxin [Candidatus Pacearchaeota archaeon]|nr:type II toxin-antitoxin system RelE/ParE family toxin [Candidatus Pacearchaeota archaeon]
MYESIIQPPAQRFIKSLKKQEQTKLLDSIEELEKNPRLGKELKGKLMGLRSLRVDTEEETYRIIYKVEDIKLIVLVLQAGYREDIYKKRISHK